MLVGKADTKSSKNIQELRKAFEGRAKQQKPLKNINAASKSVSRFGSEPCFKNFVVLYETRESSDYRS